MSADHADVIAEFCGITGSEASVAESFLAAHEFNLQQSLATFFDDPAPPPAAVPIADQHHHEAAAAMDTTAEQDDDYVEIVDDADEAGGAGLAELARQRASALAAQQQAHAAQDDPIAAAAGPAGPRARWSQPDADMGGAVGSLDMADDDLAAVAAAVAAADGNDAAGDVSGYHRRQQEELFAMYQRQAAAQQAAALHPATAAAAAAPSADEEAAGEEEGPLGAEAGRGPPAAAAAAALEEPLDLPEGINIEEARMLEAAMLGVPYAGRIPDFAAGGGAPAPLSPTTLEQHAIRREQDQAYEESLALDRAKQESIAAAAAQAEAEQRAQLEAEAAAAAEAASAAEAMKQLLASKAARLPPEPDAGTAGSMQVVVRLPTGSRKGRRFLPSDPLQAVFDFVDVECAVAAEGQAGDGSSSSIKPGSYRLVTQFPRKVLTEDSSSLGDAGINTDTALFIEAL